MPSVTSKRVRRSSSRRDNPRTRRCSSPAGPWSRPISGAQARPARPARLRSRLADRANASLVEGVAAWALGLLAVSLEQPLEAHAYLEPLVAETRTAAIREPGEMRFVPDDIEALVALGRLEEAKSVLAWYEDCGAALDRPSARATAARCHGLIASKQADLDRAIVSFQEALLQHERVAMPLERARTFLALGSAQRRAGKRRAARESLGQALAIFEQLGAAIWIQRTRTELARIGGRAAGRGQLTPVERRVAELVADGRTNKEVAAGARRHRAHHRVDPDQGVREARCALAHRACAPPQRGASLSFVDRRAHTTRGSTRQRAWVSTFRTVRARPNLEIDHRCHRHSYIPPSASRAPSLPRLLSASRSRHLLRRRATLA